MSQNPRSAASAKFGECFGGVPSIFVRAPGRINLIGEHTDYNQGFALPLAIHREVWIGIRPRMDREVQLVSTDFDQEQRFRLDALAPGQPREGWVDYFQGIAWALESEGYPVHGFEGVVASSIPAGAGLASSAAVEVACLLAFESLAPWSLAPMERARIAQIAENRWVGVACGQLDQIACAAGIRNHALLIDCQSWEVSPASIPPGLTFVVMDTTTRRSLDDSAYNQRRSNCEVAARQLGVESLRDLGVNQLEAVDETVDEVTGKRVRHVVTENARVLEAAYALRQGDLAQLGQLLDASHESLRTDYEVSCPELDGMCELARQLPGCYGARMTGAGFGGCAIAAVHSDRAESFGRELAAQFKERFQVAPSIYLTGAADGALIVF